MRRGGRLYLLLGLLIVVVVALATAFVFRGAATSSVVPNGSFQLRPGQIASAQVGMLKFALRYDYNGRLSVTSPECRVDDTLEPAPVVCGKGIIVFRIENFRTFRPGQPITVRNQGYPAYLSDL